METILLGKYFFMAEIFRKVISKFDLIKDLSAKPTVALSHIKPTKFSPPKPHDDVLLL